MVEYYMRIKDKILELEIFLLELKKIIPNDFS